MCVYENFQICKTQGLQRLILFIAKVEHFDFLIVLYYNKINFSIGYEHSLSFYCSQPKSIILSDVY